MKKIWSLLFLLLLLIIFCVCSKLDSINVNSDTKTHAAETSIISEEKRYIEYDIKQKNGNFVLNGNFKNVQQQNAFKETTTIAGSTLAIENTTTNDTLAGEEVIALTNKILPHFITHYSNGRINYHKQILSISGDVKGYEAKNEMQRLLGETSIATQNDTNVILVDPIDFMITKDKQNIQLSGTFTDKNQIHALSKHLRPSYSTINLRKNAHRVDKGSLPLTENILPHFVKHYKNGKIQYDKELLTVEGMVNSQEALDEMAKLLSHANIPIKNLTVLDPAVIQKAKDAAAVALNQVQAKEKAEADKKAQAQADAKRAQEEAQRKVQVEVDRQAKALQVEKEKARLAAEKAKLAADAAKAKITKLLKIENIAFEVGKGALTAKGESTVDKLANILTQYPHIKTEIAGHTDSDGSAEFNQKLSQSRVDMVKKRLISKGIKAERLTAKGYGESEPLVPNISDGNKQKNRRVEINILGE